MSPGGSVVLTQLLCDAMIYTYYFPGSFFVWYGWGGMDRLRLKTGAGDGRGELSHIHRRRVLA